MKATYFACFLLTVSMLVLGCTPPTVVDVNPGANENVGSITLAGSLLVTAEQLKPIVEKSATGLTAAQWAAIINTKASQVTSMDVKLAEFASGRIEYNGNLTATGIHFVTQLENVKSASYVLTTGFKGNNLQEWVFSDVQNVTVVTGQKTAADIWAALNNFCQKQLKITALDPAIAQFATPVLVITDSTGFQHTVTGTPHWFPGTPGTMEIVFEDGLAFDVQQPMLLTFNNAEGKQVASMSLSYDPVAIASFDLSIPFATGDTGTLELNVQGAPPDGVVIL